MTVLLGEPDRYRSLVDGRWTVPAVVGEMLRFETPTLFVARVPMQPITLAGVEVGPSEPLIVYLAAANHDPAVFAEPDAFRPGRDEPPALSFAFGAHYCLGASLARSEAEVMLDAVVRRWPDLRLTDEPLSWHQRGPFRGVDRLLVHPRPTA